MFCVTYVGFTNQNIEPFLYKKREIRVCYLSHSSGRRTCPIVKISNFEAHADMCTILPVGDMVYASGHYTSQQGMCINTSRGHLLLPHSYDVLQVFDV